MNVLTVFRPIRLHLLLLAALSPLLLMCKQMEPSADYLLSEFRGTFFGQNVAFVEGSNSSVYTASSVYYDSLLVGPTSGFYVRYEFIGSPTSAITMTTFLPAKSQSDASFREAVRKQFTVGPKPIRSNNSGLVVGFTVSATNSKNALLLADAKNPVFDVLSVEEVSPSRIIRDNLPGATPNTSTVAYYVTARIQGDFGSNGNVDGALRVKLTH